MRKIRINTPEDEVRSLHGPGKHNYVIRVNEPEKREEIMELLRGHQDHFHVIKGPPCYIDWTSRAGGREFLETLKSEGKIGGWGEDSKPLSLASQNST